MFSPWCSVWCGGHSRLYRWIECFQRKGSNANGDEAQAAAPLRTPMAPMLQCRNLRAGVDIRHLSFPEHWRLRRYNGESPAPAATPPDQPYYPDTNRLVCHSVCGPMRAGCPPSHQDRGDRSPSVLALIGAWDAVLRCTLGFSKSTFRRDGPCWS